MHDATAKVSNPTEANLMVITPYDKAENPVAVPSFVVQLDRKEDGNREVASVAYCPRREGDEVK
jgi:hypothetical protein